MMDIVRDMEKYCPKATLLNYTNSMAMLCGAIQRQSFIPTTGLCHSVQGTAQMLGWWIGASYDEIDFVGAGAGDVGTRHAVLRVDVGAVRHWHVRGFDEIFESVSRL